MAAIAHGRGHAAVKTQYGVAIYYQTTTHGRTG
jgi:hypothetical protein